MTETQTDRELLNTIISLQKRIDELESITSDHENRIDRLEPDPWDDG